MPATALLFAHGVPLTPESATAWGLLFLGLAGLLALIARLRRRRGHMPRLLTGAVFFGSLGLCYLATAEALRRGAGWPVLLAVWAAFPVLLVLAGSWLGSVPRAAGLRLPADAAEAERVYRRWDGLNGRYHVVADVRLADGTTLGGVVFDGDTGVAVECGGRPVSDQPELLGREVAAWVVTRDCSCGGRFGVASAEQLAAFRAGSSSPSGRGG